MSRRGAARIPVQLLEVVRRDVESGRISFKHLGEPVADACRTDLLEVTLEAEREPDRVVVVNEFVRLLMLAQESRLLASFDLPHLMFDPLRSYADNLEGGPPSSSALQVNRTSHESGVLAGHRVRSRMGVASSVLTATPAYVSYLFDLGYGAVTYKTVRSHREDAYQTPNWAFVDPEDLPDNRDLVPTAVYALEASFPKDLSTASTVNSYGVPSPDPSDWQADLRQALSVTPEDCLLLASVMGSSRLDGEQLFDDFALTARLAEEAGATVIELNMSCPNVVMGVQLEDPVVMTRLVQAVRAGLDERTQLVAKVGLLPVPSLVEFLHGTAGQIAALAGVNTVPTTVRGANGDSFFPSDGARPHERSQGGLSGHAIKHVGLRFVENVRVAAEASGTAIDIIGIGGVMTGDDYRDYLEAGASIVQGVTGVFVNPSLINECI